MTELEFQKMPLWDLPIPPPREALADDNLSLAAHRWIPGDPIPYDQMRAILGLPDVREAVHREAAARHRAQVGDALHIAARALAEHAQRIGATITANIELIRPSLDQLADAMRPRPTTPMWAIDETRTHRGRRR